MILDLKPLIGHFALTTFMTRTAAAAAARPMPTADFVVKLPPLTYEGLPAGTRRSLGNASLHQRLGRGRARHGHLEKRGEGVCDKALTLKYTKG